ncbi:amidohydrolase family protein [Tautonia marina]|uniref:amidohydrolase family protein n=1 Tax=Tautonia marina TaxID=2653855 RepID=UPI00126052E7|nr:amidohydrolase family protein [Tautonia marina]
MMMLRLALPLVLVSLMMPWFREARADQGDDADRSGVVALVGGRLLTQTEAGTIEGTILVRDGRIEAVGEAVEIPEGAERIDVSGLTVTPGLIDARSVLWLPSATRRDGGNDGALNILDGVDPFADDWIDVARSGVTAVAVQPSNEGRLGGRGAVLRVGPGGTVEELTLKADAFVQAALGVSNASGNSVLRYQQFEQLKRTLDSVKRYKEEWESYEKALAKYNEAKEKAAKKDKDEKNENAEKESKDDDTKQSETKEGEESQDDDPDESGEDSGAGPTQDEEEGDDDGKEEGETPADSKDTSEKDDDSDTKKDEPPKEPERDETKEFLVGLLKGEVPLRIEVHREDDLINALALAEEFDLKLIVEGLSDPQSTRAELVAKRTPMVLGPILELGSPPPYRRNRDRSWPSGIPAEDSRWAIGTYSDRPSDSALLRAHAASAVARGVPRDRVLRALTAGAAEVLGLADDLGTIAEGKRADLVAFAGDPIDPATAVALVLSGGDVVYRNDQVAPTEDDLATVVDLDLPDRLPSRFVLRSRRFVHDDGTTKPGALLVVDGTIAASGETVEAEDDVPVFDVGDAIVSPGLLTAHSTLGQGRAVAESAGADAGFLQAVDAFDPNGRTVREMVRGGVLRAGFAPASANVIGGAVGAVRLGSDEPVVNPVIGMNLVLSSASRNLDRFPVSLPGQVSLIRQFLGEQGEADPDVRRSLDYYLSGPAIDRLDAVRRERAALLRDGQCGAFIEVDEETEVALALDLAEELGSCVALVGPGAIETQLDRIARLASEGPDLVLVARPMPSGPEQVRRWASIRQAVEAGAGLVFAADDPEELRLLAASAVAAGLPRATALQALAVMDPIALDEPGSCWESGRPADFVIWDDTPIDLSSRPLTVVVDGRIVP